MHRIVEEQQRLRNNLTVLVNKPKEDELRAKWVKGLADAEDKLNVLRTQVEEGTDKQRILEDQIAKKILEYRGE